MRLQWGTRTLTIYDATLLLLPPPFLQAFPFTSFINHGYNKLKGNPLATASDPGWSTQPIFSLDCADCYNKGRTFGGQWAVPDELVVTNMTKQCSYNATASMIHDMQEWQAAQSRVRHFNIPINGIPLIHSLDFTGTATFAKTADVIKEKDSMFVEAKATCEVYKMQRTFPPPPSVDHAKTLSRDFVAAVRSLPPLSLKPAVLAQYYRFVETFARRVILQSTLFLD